jgi:prophage antirepressor-like protein
MEFFFEQIQVRTVLNTETNEVHVCLSDLFKAQGTTTQAHQVLPEIEVIFGDGSKLVLPIPDALGRPQDTIFICEPAAHFVISRGRTEASKRLNKWLFGEVVPAIRRTGCYVAPGADVMLAIERERSERYLAESALKDRLIEAVEAKAAAERRTADAERSRADTLEKLAAAQARLVSAGVRISPQPGTRVYRERRRMTDDIKERIIGLDAQGLSHKEIAAQVDRSRGTVASVLRREARGEEVDHAR